MGGGDAHPRCCLKPRQVNSGLPLHSGNGWIWGHVARLHRGRGTGDFVLRGPLCF